jgi:hypothetical protein
MVSLKNLSENRLGVAAVGRELESVGGAGTGQ